MNAPIRIRTTACLAAILFLLAPSVRGQDERRDEHHVVVDMEQSDGPKIWHFDRRGGYLGVSLVDLTPELRRHFGVAEDAGVMIGSIESDSPAARAGLEVGDIITAIAGTAAESRQAVAHTLWQSSDGESLSIEIVRDGRPEVVTATIEERERPQLLLSRSGDHYAFSWRSDDEGDTTPALPRPEAPSLPRPPRIEAERLDEIMGRLHERLESPEFQARMLEVRTKNAELEERIRQLEARLKDLSRKLEELED